MLAEVDFLEMSKYLTYKHVEAGEYLCHQGEKSQKMYIVLKGKLALVR
jgi:CRP-like cAMP-binding protein